MRTPLCTRGSTCLEHDPACEEAAAALMRITGGVGLRHFVVRTYDRCRAALEDLGLGQRRHWTSS